MFENAANSEGPVLVTGAGGFLGANIVWSLRAHGLAVRAVVRRPPVGPVWAGLDGVDFVEGDVRDADRMREVMRGVESVVHAAALTEVVPRRRREAFRVNVEGTRNVCEAALNEGVRRLVLTSSASTVARGTADQPADERTPFNLDDIRAPYYATKRQAERVVLDYQCRGLETIVLCPTYVIGPRDARPTTNRLLLYFATSAWPMIGPGGMNVIDVREVALAHVRALGMGEVGTRYLLAGPYSTYAEMGRIVRRVLGLDERVGVMPRWACPVGSFFLAVASVLPLALPDGLSLPSFRYGFVPFHVTGAEADRAFGLTHRPVEESIRDTLDWFQQTGFVTTNRPAGCVC